MANIYNATGNEIAAGLQSSTVCDEAVILARTLAAKMGEEVFIEDDEERTTVYPDGSTTDGWDWKWMIMMKKKHVAIRAFKLDEESQNWLGVKWMCITIGQGKTHFTLDNSASEVIEKAKVRWGELVHAKDCECEECQYYGNKN